MSTEKVTVAADEWTNISTDATLTNGTAYFVQNLSGNTVYIQEAASEPSDTTGAKHILNPGGSPGDILTLTQQDGQFFFARPQGFGSVLAVTEAG